MDAHPYMHGQNNVDTKGTQAYSMRSLLVAVFPRAGGYLSHQQYHRQPGDQRTHRSANASTLMYY